MVSSMTWRKYGSRWPTSGCANARVTRGSTLDGPGPNSSRMGASPRRAASPVAGAEDSLAHMPNFNPAGVPPHISRRAFAERLALAAAAPYVTLDVSAPTQSSVPPSLPTQQPEPSPLARALAESIRLRYGDRLSADDLKAITEGIEARLQGVERLYRIALTNGDEPDFVFSVYRGAD